MFGNVIMKLNILYNWYRLIMNAAFYFTAWGYASQKKIFARMLLYMNQNVDSQFLLLKEFLVKTVVIL
jgi:hypothetical protein